MDHGLLLGIVVISLVFGIRSCRKVRLLREERRRHYEELEIWELRNTWPYIRSDN